MGGSGSDPAAIELSDQPLPGCPVSSPNCTDPDSGACILGRAASFAMLAPLVACTKGNTTILGAFGSLLPCSRP